MPSKELQNLTIDSETYEVVDAAARSSLTGKADKATSISGYGISDAYTTTQVDTLLDGKISSDYRKVTGTGSFAGLLTAEDRIWLIVVQRVSTNASCVLLAHKHGTSYLFKEIVKDSGFSYNYNNQGTVTFTYGGSSSGIYGGAYRFN